MCVQISTDKSSSCQHELHEHLFREPGTQEQDTEMAGYLASVWRVWRWPDLNPALTFGSQACNPRPWKETATAPNRDAVCPPKAGRLMVLPGIVETREWSRNFWRVFDARTGRTLSTSDWRRQKLSPPAEFSRHCLMIYSNFLDAFV